MCTLCAIGHTACYIDWVYIENCTDDSTNLHMDGPLLFSEAVHEKGLVPVQRVAKDVASRAAAKSFFFVRKYGGKEKGEKRFPVGPNIPGLSLEANFNWFMVGPVPSCELGSPLGNRKTWLHIEQTSPPLSGIFNVYKVCSVSQLYQYIS